MGFNLTFTPRTLNASGRSMLVTLLMLAMEMVPVIENPASTVLNQHRRFVGLVRTLRELGVSAPWIALMPY